MSSKESDYSSTPSYFNNCEYFNKYLGRTSYYTALQDALCIAMSRIKPEKVIELGCALGTTAFALADKFPESEIYGLDMREDVVSKTNRMQESRDFSGRDNAFFVCADMTRFVQTEELSGYDFIYMLYSFHHILDQMENKIQFLEDAYRNMKEGAYLWIGETFLPENKLTIKELWLMRAKEGYASTFWNCLKDNKGISLKRAKEAAAFSHNEEYKAGEHVSGRDNEYLVTFPWTVNAVQNAGFEVVISEPVNALGDNVILAKKTSAESQ